MGTKISAVLVDNGEPFLPRCIDSLRKQTVPVSIILCRGPSTDFQLAKALADKVLDPVEGIGKARVKGILEANSEYILSCDSDTYYAENYAEIALEDLQRAKAVKAGIILPLKWKEPLVLLETALSSIPCYEFALAFRRKDFLRAGIVEEAERYGADRRWDIGGAVVTRLNAWPDFRMKVLTRMPTKGAWGFVENYAVPLLAGTVPLAITAGVVGASRFSALL